MKMRLAVAIVMLAMWAQGLGSGVASGQDAPPQSTPAPVTPKQSAPQKPCPGVATGAVSPSTPCPVSPVVRHRKRRAVKPEATVDAPSKTVVRNGGTAEPAMDLAPGVSQQQVSKQGQKASDLLTSTDANLKKIGARQLDAAQQETVGQIKSYVEQAKAAANDGDVQRAYNLALKANLLSADLAGK